MSSYYAVSSGRKTGIFNTWAECTESVKGYQGAKYKKFNNINDANEFINNSSNNEKSFEEKSLKPAPDYYVYTDGACANNGRPNAKAGIGVYFGENDPRNVSAQVHPSDKQSNNVAELIAIITAYKIIEPDLIAGKKVCIASDSKYSIHCAKEYGKEHASNGWTKDIPNKELVKQIYNIFSKSINVELMHVAAHTTNTDPHSIGNDGADRLANKAIGIEDGCPYNKPSKIYLNVPFSRKDEAKALGARWDATNKKWYTDSLNSELTHKFP